MATQHAFFYPFLRENCKMIVKNLKTLEESLVDAVGQMMGDPKGITAFTIDSYLTNPIRVGRNTRYDENRQDDVYKKMLINLTEKTTLYVCGHSGAGLGTISSPDEKVELKSIDLVKYLKNLPNTWPGRIKCFGCESENSSGWWHWASQSFAKRVYDELHKTHPNLAVYGYTHAVATWPTQDPASGSIHKFVDGERSSKYLRKVQ